MKKRLAAVCLVAALCLTGCTLGNKRATNGTEGKNKITYKNKIYNNDKKDENNKTLLALSVSYPVFESAIDKDKTEKINNLIKYRAEEFAQNTAELYSYMLDSEEGHEMEMTNPYRADYIVTVKRCDKKVISLETTISQYTGGAHSMQSYKGLTLDYNTGEEISFENLTDDSPKLYGDVADYVKKLSSSDSYKERISDPENINVRKFIRDKKWYLSDSGLVVMTDPYEIACYAEGSIEFTVPYENLSDIKKEYSYDVSYK